MPNTYFIYYSFKKFFSFCKRKRKGRISRPRSSLGDNIKIYFKEIEFTAVEWVI